MILRLGDSIFLINIYSSEIDINKLIDFDKSLNDGAIDFPTFQPGGWRLTRYTESGNFDNDKKLKNYTQVELDLLLNDTGSSPKNPTKDWPKTSTYIGIIPVSYTHLTLPTIA